MRVGRRGPGVTPAFEPLAGPGDGGEIAPGRRGPSVVPGVAADVEALAPLVAWIGTAVAANGNRQEEARATARALPATRA